MGTGDQQMALRHTRPPAQWVRHNGSGTMGPALHRGPLAESMALIGMASRGARCSPTDQQEY
jgi:hypothetical protein